MSLNVIGSPMIWAGLMAIVAYLWFIHKVVPSPSSSRLQAEYGLCQIYPPPGISPKPTQPTYKRADKGADKRKTTVVVFVHGLGADPSKAWHDGDVCWITDAEFFLKDLGEKALLSSVQLFTFNYNSYWVRDASSTRLQITAEDLWRGLDSDEVREHDIVLVGHSYGGLVIKKALADSPSSLKDRVKGILFLGTPHRGTPYTRVGLALARLLAPLDADVDIMRPLIADSVDLDDLEKRFSMDYANTKRVYFFERHKMRGYILGLFLWQEWAVPEQSATAGANQSQRISLDTDHRHLNRFRKRNDDYRKVAQELLNILQENSNTLPNAASSLQEGHWVVPFERNMKFVERESILKKTIEAVRPGMGMNYCRKAAIVGLGGVGKTQIALEVAHRVREESPECSVFWVPAVDSASFEQAYRDIGKALGIDGIMEPGADVKPLVKTALSRSNVGKWLLIVDNADDQELMFGKQTTDGSDTGPLLARNIPFNPNGSILFTTRDRKVAVALDVEIIDVASMKPDEAQGLLETHLDPKLMGDATTTTRLVSLLDDLPLAIKQAAAFMNANQTPAARYLEIYKSNNDEKVFLLSQEFADLGRYSSTKNPIAKTWLVSFRQICKSNPLAADCLRLMCLLAEHSIPLALLAHGVPGEKAMMAGAIGTLKAYAFITEREHSESYDMHRLVQVAAQCWLKSEGTEWQEWTAKAAERLAGVFTFPGGGNFDLWTDCLPHVTSVLRNMNREQVRQLHDLLYGFPTEPKKGRKENSRKLAEMDKLNYINYMKFKISIVVFFRSQCLMARLVRDGLLHHRRNHEHAEKGWREVLAQQVALGENDSLEFFRKNWPGTCRILEDVSLDMGDPQKGERRTTVPLY